VLSDEPQLHKYTGNEKNTDKKCGLQMIGTDCGTSKAEAGWRLQSTSSVELHRKGRAKRCTFGASLRLTAQKCDQCVVPVSPAEAFLDVVKHVVY